MVVGDNGILNRATDASQKTSDAKAEEQRQFSMAEAAMNFDNTEYTDPKDSKNKIIIPAGYAVSGVDGENTIDGGLVIIDSKGNEFVWVKVPKINEVYKNTGLDVTEFNDTVYENIENDLKDYVSDYKGNDENFADEWYYNCGILNESEYKKLKNNMLRGIYSDGGFWVGRYEVGYEETDIRAYEDVNAVNPINQIPVVKKNAYPYNNLRVYQAQQLSSNFINDNKYQGSLMFGIQWDLICKFMEVNGGLTKDKIKNDSSSWGNYRTAEFDMTSGSYSKDNGKTFLKVDKIHTKPLYEQGYGELLTAGANKRNSVLNIYDIAGNLWELTLEQAKTRNVATARGGGYYFDGKRWQVNCRTDVGWTVSYNYVGFRIALIPR